MPEFVSAEINELAGPGLRISAPLKVKAGDRVIVVFKLTEEHHSDSVNSVNLHKSKIIEDIGVVRRCRASGDGFSIAVEMTGLTDSNICQMVRATNFASRRYKADIQEVSSVNGRQKKEVFAEMVTSR